MLDTFSYCPDTGVFRNRSTGGAVGYYCKGYLHIGYQGKNYRASRLAFLFMGVELPEDQYVDHINGIKDDNRWCNLRIATPKENNRNSAKYNKNKSGIPNVWFYSRRGMWRVRCADSKTYYVADFFEACCIRKRLENEIGGFTERHGR